MARIAAVDGNGPTKVLVLPGWALDSSVWLKTRAASDVSDFTWAYADFPGYGVNRDSAPVEGIDGMARFALDAADELGWNRFALLGHSMGGTTALRVATLAPERVTSVVAVTPVSPAGTPLDAATYAAFDSAWTDPGAAIRGSLSPVISDTDLGLLVQRNRATLSQPVWSKYFANWSSSPSFMAELSGIHAPVTVLRGEADPFVTLDYLHETIDTLANGHVEVLSGSAHYPMVENPAQLVEQIQRALRSTAAASASASVDREPVSGVRA